VFTVSVQMPAAVEHGVAVFDAQGKELPAKVLSSDAKTNSYTLLVEAKDVPSMGYEVLNVRPAVAAATHVKKADSAEYNYKLRAMQVEAYAGSLPTEHSYVSVTPETVVLTAVKKAEDANGLIFRVVEWAGKDSTVRFSVPPGATSATETNLMEQPVGAALQLDGNSVQVSIKPYEILTLRVDYGR